jgi:hypothetical protein
MRRPGTDRGQCLQSSLGRIRNLSLESTVERFRESLASSLYGIPCNSDKCRIRSNTVSFKTSYIHTKVAHFMVSVKDSQGGDSSSPRIHLRLSGAKFQSETEEFRTCQKLGLANGVSATTLP